MKVIFTFLLFRIILMYILLFQSSGATRVHVKDWRNYKASVLRLQSSLQLFKNYIINGIITISEKLCASIFRKASLPFICIF